MNKTIHKANPLQGYSIVPNWVSRSKSLTLQARGLLIYLLSMDENWEVRFDVLKKELELTTYGLRKIIKELEEAGHMKLHALRGEGGEWAGKRWKVYAEPVNDGECENRTVGNSHSVEEVPLSLSITNTEKKKSSVLEDSDTMQLVNESEEHSVPSLPLREPPEAEPFIPRGVQKNIPSQDEWSQFVTEHDLWHVGLKKEGLREEWIANGWKTKKGDPSSRIKDWKKTLIGLEAKMERDTKK